MPTNTNINSINGRTRADLKNTSKGGDDDNNDNDKDNDFFGNWVKGNWCYLLSKHDNNDDGADADSVDTSYQIRHRKNNYDNSSAEESMTSLLENANDLVMMTTMTMINIFFY